MTMFALLTDDHGGDRDAEANSKIDKDGAPALSSADRDGAGTCDLVEATVND